MNSLSAIANKTPIISTFGAEALRNSPAAVRESYDWHAATYVEQRPLADLRKGFIAAVLEAKTPKACLVAPFGYGKTATAVGLWRACQAANILTVPPISCNSLTEVARAIFDWLMYVLPSFGAEIIEAHDRFLASSAASLARRDEQKFGIPYEQAFAAISDKLERGYIDFEDVSVNLVAFLDYAAAVAVRGGYSGLVIIVDEMQQLIGNANKGVLVALRQLVWGLRTRKLPLGLVLTMDPATERTLADRAGDVLHRIKDDGYYLSIGDVYDRTFPARLWKQYVSAFQLADDTRTAIDDHCLGSLGQLCERDDLSNGPRTVINALQLAANRHEISGQPYGPIDLIDDFLTGAIRFDGDRAVLPGLLRELLNLPYFQRSPDRSRALKLIAAFPRGCSRTVAAEYGLATAWEGLSDELRGEIVCELDEGMALIELQRAGRPANQLNVLLRKYWMEITDQQLFAEDAPKAFTESVLQLLFREKVNDLQGWSGQDNIQLTAESCYAGLLEGTSSPGFPLRRVAIAIVADEQRVPAIVGATDSDFVIVFRLNLSSTGASSVTVGPDPGAVEFSLVVARAVDGGLPGSLSWIEHYISPHPVSAAVVLSLLRYFGRQDTGDFTPRDQARFADTLARLRGWLLNELLPAELFHRCGYDVVQSGFGALQEFLYIRSAERWPAYHSLVTHQHWDKLYSDYIDALRQISSAARTGVVNVHETKGGIAALFGQTRHAGFESHARQYGDLLSVVEWRGDMGTVRFVPHPLELQIVSTIRKNGPCEVDAIYWQLRSEGVASPEADLILRLMSARGLVEEQAGTLTLPRVPAVFELLARAQALASRMASVPEIEEDCTRHLTSLTEQIAQGQELHEIAVHLDRLEGTIAKAEKGAIAARATKHRIARGEFLACIPLLRNNVPSPVNGGLKNHLNALRQLMEDERQELSLRAEQFVANTGSCDLLGFDLVGSQIREWRIRSDLYGRWVAFATRLANITKGLDQLELRQVLPHISLMVGDLLSSARAVLAQLGVEGLNEISRLELRLVEAERMYALAADQREAAYEKLALLIRSQTDELLGLTLQAGFPAYNSADDEHSLASLKRATATSMTRAVALFNLELVGCPDSPIARLALAKLRSDIRLLARRVADPDWLLAELPLRIRTDAKRSIAAVRKRVAQHVDQTVGQVSVASPHLIGALAGLPPGPTDIAELLEKTNGVVERQAMFAQLASLQAEGSIRMTIEVIGDDV